MSKGYTPCACRDCFEIAFDDGMCSECEEAGCDGGDAECEAPGAYGLRDACAHGNWLCDTPGCPSNVRS